MLHKLFKSKIGQNTAEYALLIALVVAGVIAMQTYAQRSLQARMRDASTYLQRETNGIGNTKQYEPYYLTSDYEISRNSEEVKRLDTDLVYQNAETFRNRELGGFQESTYDTTIVNGGI